MINKIQCNLACLKKILSYNITHQLLFFRISSDLIPFASHPICTFDWQNHFSQELSKLGKLIKTHNMRISMHPDQFVLLNSPNPDIVEKSIADLTWHCQLLDTMELDHSAKVQIHVGGMYNDKPLAIKRFTTNYHKLPQFIKNRLAIENDDRLFSLRDCIHIAHQTHMPIIFDNLHHTCLNHGETFLEALQLAQTTWQDKDGILMTDYSSQAPNARKGKHIEHIDLHNFTNYLQQTKDLDFDIMLEIKDKETSALQALAVAQKCNKIPI